MCLKTTTAADIICTSIWFLTLILEQNSSANVWPYTTVVAIKEVLRGPMVASKTKIFTSKEILIETPYLFKPESFTTFCSNNH